MNVAPHFPSSVHVEHPWSTPLWAANLISRVMHDHGDVRHVELVWRRSRQNRFTSGHISGHTRGATDPRIVITAGSVLIDQRHTLLHELAHLVSREAHTRWMYAVAWTLYRRYNSRNLAHSAIREAIYRPTSMNAPGAPRKVWILDAWRGWPYRHTVSTQKRGIMDALSELVADRPRRGRKKVASNGAR